MRVVGSPLPVAGDAAHGFHAAVQWPATRRPFDRARADSVRDSEAGHQRTT
jgi:hypothetical protein